MKSQYLIYSILALFLFSFGFSGVLAQNITVNFTDPTPINGTVLNLTNEFTIAFNASDNPVNASITIEDALGNPTVYDLLNINTPYSANFTLPLGAYYYWVSVNNNGTSNMTEIRKITADAYQLIVENIANDPNAIDHNSFVTNSSFATKYIKASTTLVSDYIIRILNSSNVEVANFTTVGKSDFKVNIKDTGLSDGWYSYYVFANYSATKNITSEMRNFSIDRSIPAVVNSTLSVTLPFGMRNDESKVISLNGSFSEFPVNLSLSITNANGTTVISSIIVNEGANLPIEFAIPTGLSPAEYNLSLSVRDFGGNSANYNLGSFSVTQAPAPDNGNRGNGGNGNRGGNAPAPVVESPNVVLVNDTNVTQPLANLTNLTNTGDNNSTVNETESKNFFNSITGAVTGAFQNRSIVVIIVVLVILVLAWIFSGFLVPVEEKKKVKEVKTEKSSENN